MALAVRSGVPGTAPVLQPGRYGLQGASASVNLTGATAAVAVMGVAGTVAASQVVTATGATASVAVTGVAGTVTAAEQAILTGFPAQISVTGVPGAFLVSDLRGYSGGSIGPATSSRSAVTVSGSSSTSRQLVGSSSGGVS